MYTVVGEAYQQMEDMWFVLLAPFRRFAYENRGAGTEYF